MDVVPWPAWSTRRFVLVVMAVVVVVRSFFLLGPLYPDEAGFLVVARDWHAGGPNLYGHYFVDRPPLLLAIYALGALAGWAPVVRLVATALALVTVASAAWAAHQVVGARGTGWAAALAGAFAITPLLTAQEADGEVLAAPLVMLSVALTLHAVRRRAFPPAVAAGLAAGAALMVKQNFADGVVFAAVLLAVAVLQRRLDLRGALRVGSGGVLGGLLVLAGALAYVAWSRVGVATAWATLFGFRGRALDVIEDHGLHATASRAVELTGLALVCGVLPVLLVLVLDAWRCGFRGPPVAWAVGLTVALEGVSIALGGSYWPHYLIQLAPMIALAAGLWAADSRRLRLATAYVVASALAAAGVVTLTGAAFRHDGQDVGQFLHASARPGDTATVLFGNADVQEASGMPSPYRQLWTLPMRTYDPALLHLRRTLTGPRAPTWVVAWHDLDPWRIDPHGRLRLVLAIHYHRVATVCGHEVLLHDGVHRTPAPQGCGPP